MPRRGARHAARPDAGRRARPAALDAGGRPGGRGRRPHRVRQAVEELGGRRGASGRSRMQAVEQRAVDDVGTARFEVAAVRYGTLRAPKSELFHRYESYGEPDAEVEMAYYFWVLRRAGRDDPRRHRLRPRVGERRGRTCDCAPLEALSAARRRARRTCTRPSSSRTSTTTTSGTSRPSREAQLVVPRKELEFWTGPFADRLPVRSRTSSRQRSRCSTWRDRSGRVRLTTAPSRSSRASPRSSSAATRPASR